MTLEQIETAFREYFLSGVDPIGGAYTVQAGNIDWHWKQFSKKLVEEKSKQDVEDEG